LEVNNSVQESLKSILSEAGIEDELIQEIQKVGISKTARSGELIITPGSTSMYMPIVLEGLLSVVRQDGDANEILLYYLEGGETCAMSLACCIEGKRNDFKVTAEDNSVLWMIPMNYMDEWIQNYRSFRKYVFSSYQTRFDELLETIDSITFLNLYDRLYKYLLDKKQATKSYEINMSHEQIAQHLNTSRVVVSRLLKQLENEGKIELERNRISIL
jgi:CRP/FNR family transcriptional regulator, anaerobic regulatory protein|tara:strand:+ start:20762 stop:21409 length:648 start_codon:yes stop_codon:yes gene_type:complete